MNDSPFEAVCSTRTAVPFARVNLWVTGDGGPENLPKCCHYDELAAIQHVFHLLCECPEIVSPAPSARPSDSPSQTDECRACKSSETSNAPSSTPSFGCMSSLSQSLCQNYAVHAITSIAFAGEVSTIHSGDLGIYPSVLLSGAY
jgi:hypothetical protein